MRRRDFIALLGGAAVGWPLSGNTQQPATPVIGFLNGQSPEPWAHLTAAFRRGLSEGGYTEGRNLTIEFRFAQDRPDRLPGLATDLIKHQVQLIVTSGGEVAARAVMAATSTVPIIATFGGDPVESGFVVSINRPGRNVTGVSLFNVELVAKQLEMLHQALPGVTEMSVLANGTNPNTKRMLRAAEAAAPALGVNMLTFTAATDSEIDNAFAALSQKPASALVVFPDPLFNARRRQLVALATQHRIPTMFFRREFPLIGGLMSYASDQVEDYRQLGVYAAKILSGTKPAEMPIMQPSKLELVINLNTAKALGITVPPALLARTDEIIE